MAATVVFQVEFKIVGVLGIMGIAFAIGICEIGGNFGVRSFYYLALHKKIGIPFLFVEVFLAFVLVSAVISHSSESNFIHLYYVATCIVLVPINFRCQKKEKSLKKLSKRI